MIEDILPLLSVGVAVMVVLMTALWALHLRIRNAGIVDVGWAGGIALLAFYYGVAGDGFGPRRILMTCMVMVWGVRLARHLMVDRVIGQPEDPRYQTLRQGWTRAAGLRMFLFFQAQALLTVILSFPFALLATDPLPNLSTYEYAAFLLWVIAWVGESIADAQLKAFKADPANKGKTCDWGLWNYSRHPNYFFEWLIWVAYFIAALTTPYGWISIFCPLLMLFFLFKVTGIPATEAQALRSRGETYRDYQRTTSAFVPWFKKHS